MSCKISSYLALSSVSAQKVPIFSGCCTTPLEHTPSNLYQQDMIRDSGIPFIVGYIGGLVGVCDIGVVLQFSLEISHPGKGGRREVESRSLPKGLIELEAVSSAVDEGLGRHLLLGKSFGGQNWGGWYWIITLQKPLQREYI